MKIGEIKIFMYGGRFNSGDCKQGERFISTSDSEKLGLSKINKRPYYVGQLVEITCKNENSYTHNGLPKSCDDTALIEEYKLKNMIVEEDFYNDSILRNSAKKTAMFDNLTIGELKELCKKSKLNGHIIASYITRKMMF